MKNIAPYILPSILGLVTGIGHGISAHYQDMPFSLAEQVIESVQGYNSFN